MALSEEIEAMEKMIAESSVLMRGAFMPLLCQAWGFFSIRSKSEISPYHA